MPQEQFKFPSLIKRVDSSTPLPDKKQRLIYDAYVRKAQEQDSLGKKIGRGAVDSVAGLIQGLFGLDDGTSPLSINNPADVGKGIGSVLTSGLPFSKIMKGKPVIHGTGRIFDRFDPSRYDKSDTLGSFTHFAERPEYADSYAFSDMKVSRGENPNVIPVHINAKNTLDLTTPYDVDNSVPLTPEDMAAFISAAPNDKKRILKDYYLARMPHQNNDQFIDVDSKALMRTILDSHPEMIKNTSFDAIRYTDAGHPAWAVPDTTNIRTPWGVDLTPDRYRIPKPIRLMPQNAGDNNLTWLLENSGKKYW